MEWGGGGQEEEEEEAKGRRKERMRKSRRKKGKRKILPSSAIGKMKLKVLFNFSMPLVNYAASNGHTRVAYPESLQEVAKSAERKMLS